MEYVCKVGTPAGAAAEHTSPSPDDPSLRRDLEERGYYLFNVRRGAGLASLGIQRRGIQPHLLIVFCQELAALMRAGLPLLQSLDVMLERQQDPVFRSSLTVIRDKVKTGIALSEAFRAE